MLKVFLKSVVATLVFACAGRVAAAGDLGQAVMVDPGLAVAEIAMRDERPVVRDRRGRWHFLHVSAQGITTSPVVSTVVKKRPDGMLPDGMLATGTSDIVRAWLAEPTRSYRHGILGDKIEARRLVIEARNKKQQSYRLGNASVFEDLVPRLADLDGDGTDEIIVVRAYLDRGAALVVSGLRDGKLVPVAETPAIGRPHRWLNPAGIADYDGDGNLEVAIVVTPHIGGTLQLWRLAGGKLKKTGELAGFSNHIIGSRILGLSATGDFDGDGIADLALPSADRGTLRLVSFAGRTWATRALPLRSRISGGVVFTGTKIIAALDNGQLALVSLSGE